MASLFFIHCADLHLDRPFQGLRSLPAELTARVRESTFRSFRRMIDAAIANQVDFIVIAGDLFDEENRSLRAQARFRDGMRRLEEYGIQAFVIHGNHDPLGGDWAALSWPDNVHLFGAEVETIPFIKNRKVAAQLHGFSYAERAVAEKKISFYEKTGEAPYHIGILHGQADGSGGEHASYAPFTVNELLEKDFDYWALGHIHKRQLLSEQPVIHYPGNIQGLNPKETGEKGCTLVEMDGESTHLTFIPTADLEWGSCEISISGVDETSHLVEICERKLESLRKESNAVLAVLHFSGAGPMHAFLHESGNIEDLFFTVKEGEETRKDCVWPVSWQIDTLPDWDRAELKKENHFIGDLLRLIDEQGAEGALSPLLGNRRAKRFISEFEGNERNEILNEAENLLLTELLREGARK